MSAPGEMNTHTLLYVLTGLANTSLFLHKHPLINKLYHVYIKCNKIIWILGRYSNGMSSRFISKLIEFDNFKIFFHNYLILFVKESFCTLFLLFSNWVLGL